MNNTFKIILLLSFIAIVFYFASEMKKQNIRLKNEISVTQSASIPDTQNVADSPASPIVDNINMVNSKGQVVDKYVRGSFRVVDTGEIFESTERYEKNISSLRDYNNNTINDCINLDCDTVYFVSSSNNEQGRTAIFSDVDNPIRGVISSVKFYSDGKQVSSYPSPHKQTDSVVYTISFFVDEIFKTINQNEELCVGHKGGGFSCREPMYALHDNVIFFNDLNTNSLRGIFLENELTEAQLVSYQYYMVPNTGQVFPVIKR